jgi:hypothetical protein
LGAFFVKFPSFSLSIHLCHVKLLSLIYRWHIIFLKGTNIATKEEVAIKLECVKTKHPQLHIEAKFYKMMQSGGNDSNNQ